MRQIIIGLSVFLLWMILSTWYYTSCIYPVISQIDDPSISEVVDASLTTTPEAPPLPDIPEDITLYFGFDKSKILNPDILLPYIKSGLEYLAADSSSCLIVSGYTCDIGTAAYNMALSMRRATAVHDFLKKNGLSSECISISGKGEESPALPNTGEANRKLNRRVVIHINH
jgi:OOP family OmpA-OmpF porin